MQIVYFWDNSHEMTKLIIEKNKTIVISSLSAELAQRVVKVIAFNVVYNWAGTQHFLQDCLCAQGRLSAACAFWWESSLSAWVRLRSLATHSVLWILWSDCVDAQVYLSLGWAHMQSCRKWYYIRNYIHMKWGYIHKKNWTTLCLPLSDSTGKTYAVLSWYFTVPFNSERV